MFLNGESSQWCGEVHGDCIQIPSLPYPFLSIQLYPKGIGGQGQHLVVRLCDVFTFSGELSFCSSDGSLLCSKQQVDARCNEDLELPPGPKFEDVLSRISREDFITVKLRVKGTRYWQRRLCTTIHVLKISVKMYPRWIKERESSETKEVCVIIFSPDNYSNRMELYTCSKNNVVHFMINPPPKTEFEYPFAVQMCLSVTRSDDTVDSCVKKEHVFRDNSPWTFPDPLQKKELIGKGVSLFLCLKTRNMIQNYNFINYDYRNVNFELNNTICLSQKATSTDPETSKKVKILTNDSGSQTSDIPDTSVLTLTKELMCLYQDQEFSDITLKCDNVTFPVHKNILSARSTVFKSMLSTDMQETASSEVDIRDLDPSTLSLFLTYLYTGAVEEELQCDRALKLYYAADKYQVPSLKRNCSEFLRSNVSLSNVCDILSLADRHQDDELTAASHDFILDNYNDVLKSKEWNILKKNEPALVAETLTHFAVKDCVARKNQHK